MVNNRKEKILAYMCLFITICFSIVFFIKFLVNTSVGADNQKIIIEANLDKYINYEISDQDKGTLIQYNVRTGIEYGNEDYIPLKSSELAINLNQIDGKYPYAVKIITKRTELTNGKIENMEDNYEYDSNTGIIMIRVSNQDENGEIINTTKPSDIAKDEYVIIAYYDTYVEQEEERELDIKVQSTVTLSIDDRKITQENEFKGMVKDNIGELTSVTSEADEIYNGYIKSNMINGTNYDTEYKETAKIMVSKKEAGQKIEFKESNSFERVYQNSSGEEITEEISSNGDLVYKSTKLKQQDIKRLLGENAVVEILDGNSNLIATINQNTQFTEDGSVVINYENEPESIIIKTSEIKSEGILPIENTKKIKSTMKNMEYNKIKTAIEISGIKEEVTTNGEEETKTEKIVFANHYENTSDIKESTNNINFDVSSMEWTNQYQNEITFNTYISSNSTKDNMLKNPIIKIELPSEVEKVILGESSVIYANGLELQDPYLETNENGNIVIATNLVGTQTNYDENTLGLVTDVKISATIILKKDIESTTGNVNLTYTNQYNVNGRTEVENRSTEIKIASYKEENIVEDNPSITTYANTSLLTSTVENIEGLTVEVTPVKGDTVLKDGDTVYEGEFIKYNIKVTNTSDKQIDDIKVVGTVPEGTTYGELEADYHSIWGKYDYHYDDTVKEKTISIGTILAGKSYETFYEVKVDDLDDSKENKETSIEIKLYANTIEVANYKMEHLVENSDAKVFLTSDLNGIGRDGWNYNVKIVGDANENIKVKLKVPKEFAVEDIFDANQKNEEAISDKKIENNEVSFNVDLSQYDKDEEFSIYIGGTIDETKLLSESLLSETELLAVATVTINDSIYTSNENRIKYYYDNMMVTMSSITEGENVNYSDEIEYDIVIKNIGNSNLTGYATWLTLKDYLPEDLTPEKVIYESWVESEKVTDEENSIVELTGEFEKKQFEEKIISESYDTEGNLLPQVDLSIIVPYGETANVKIIAKVNKVDEKTKIENSATIVGSRIYTRTSNTISHVILPYNDEENDEPDAPTNPDNPSDPSNPDTPRDNDEKYSISGVAWLDENGDGKRQTDEKLLGGIPVMLVNTANSSTIQAKEVTDSNGVYRFSGLEEGNYIVIFNYDTDTYSVTEYQKNEVSSALNSDATTKEITLLGTQTKAGVTDIITLDASIQNIDIGLIKNKICDLKLDKYISKVTVKTKSGTKEQSYNNTQLAKVEIKSKEIQGATIVIEYKIVITNEGEIPTSVNRVIDYLPDGLEFSSELNKSWTTMEKGKITNTSISNQKIDPGKSIELMLVATKTMTSNSTGTFTNIAEIGQISNSADIKDIDSTPENKAESEDDYSKADLIISVSTGAVIYVSTIFVIVLIIIFILYFRKKINIKKISKVFIVVAILGMFMGISANQFVADANSLPNALWLKNPTAGAGYGINFYDEYGNFVGTCALERRVGYIC